MSCNKCCCADSCISVSLADLDDLLYKTDVEIVNLSEAMKNEMFYGPKYNKGNCDNAGTIQKLTCYKDSLLRYYKRLSRNFNQCICPTHIQSIIEQVLDIIKVKHVFEREDIIIDDSKTNYWISQNPYCVSREVWEELAYHVCSTIGLTLTLDVESQCNITFDIVRESIDCNVLYGFTVANQTCAMGVSVNRTDEECELDYELLLETTKCDLEYSLYKELVEDCNLTFEAIKTAVECGITFNADHTFTCNTGSTYKLADIDCESIFDISILDYIENNSISKERYLDDYILTQEQQNQL